MGFAYFDAFFLLFFFAIRMGPVRVLIPLRLAVRIALLTAYVMVFCLVERISPVILFVM